MNHIHNSTVVTVEESVLRMEMVDLESQEEDVPNRVLFFKTISWMGQIRSHRRDESWSGGLWKTFFSTSMSDVKKDHDWVVDQLTDLFRTTHKVKTQQVVKSRVQYCGDLTTIRPEL